MSCLNGFGRGLLFALLCACVAPLYLGVAQLALGRGGAFASYLTLAAATYLMGIARRPRHGFLAAGTTGLCGGLLWLFGAGVLELAVGLGALIGVFRSGLLYRDPRASIRGFALRCALEIGLIGSGLALAAHLLRDGLFPEAWALWGFFLVQSAFFLSRASAPTHPRDASTPREPDPFEVACRRARELLET